MKTNSNKVGAVTVRVVDNGYVVKPCSAFHGEIETTFVFETWDSLTKWLHDNMATPEQS